MEAGRKLSTPVELCSNTYYDIREWAQRVKPADGLIKKTN